MPGTKQVTWWVPNNNKRKWGLNWILKNRPGLNVFILFCFEYTEAEGSAGNHPERKFTKVGCKYSIPKGREEMEQPWGFNRRLTLR